MPEQPPPDLHGRREPPGSERTIIESLQTGLVVYRLEAPGERDCLRLESCNAAAGRMLAVEPSQVIGLRMFDAFPGSHDTVIPDLLSEVIESGRRLVMNAVPYRDVRKDAIYDLHVFALPGRRCGVEFTSAVPRLKVERELDASNHQLRRALESLWSERELSQKLQLCLLPPSPQVIEDYDVAVGMRTAPIVGGDYVDAFELNGAGWLLIGDVSGRGLPAGLLSGLVQTSVRSVVASLELAGIRPRPSAVLEAVNAAVAQSFRTIDADQYMTLTALRVMGGRVMHAGLHQDLLVHRAANDALDRFESEGLWLGVLAEGHLNLTDQSFQLAEGDTLLLYTDGLTDRPGGKGGHLALAAAFHELSRARLSVAELAQQLMDRRTVEPLRDDSTLLVARRRGRDHAH